jgi:tetratricopeptide (TPR) repeat protein
LDRLGCGPGLVASRVKRRGDCVLSVFRSPTAAASTPVEFQPDVGSATGAGYGGITAASIAATDRGQVLDSGVHRAGALSAVALLRLGLARQERVEEMIGLSEVQSEGLDRRFGALSHGPTARSDAFVGRSWERRELAAAIARSMAGRGELVLIGGEAGIGKTRLAREALTDAIANGCTTMWAACWEGDDAPPYWPWTQLIRSLSDAVDVEAGRRLDRRALAVLVPEISDDPPLEVFVDHVAARARVFSAVVALLAAASKASPLVVVFDDLQWADEPSLLLLRHLSSQLPTQAVAVIGTYRDNEVASDTARSALFASLARGGLALRLGGLDADELAVLVADAVGREVSREWLETLVARTAGNPFFANEVVRFLAATGGAAGTSLASVPPSVVEVVNRRVARLPDGVKEVLDVAAAVGEQFGIDVLVPGGDDMDPILDALDAASRAGLLQRTEDGFCFTHAVVREALYERLGSARRARLHQRLGVTLEGMGAPTEVLARHFLAAVPLGEADRAVGYAVAAGETALARLAHEDALAWFSRAIGLTKGRDDEMAMRSLLGQAEAHRRAGDTAAARADLDAVVAACRRTPNAVMLARAAVGVHRLGSASGQLHDEAVELLEDARRELGDDESELRALVLSALATELWCHTSGRADEALALSVEALTVAERVGSAGTLAHCLEARHMVVWVPGAAEERAAIARQMAGVARTSGDGEQHATALLLEATALLELADPRALVVADRFFEVGSPLGLPKLDYLVLTRRAGLAILRGDLDAGAGLIEQAAALGQQIGEPDAPVIDYHLRSELLRFSGGRGELVDRSIRTDAFGSLLGVVERPVMLLDAGRIDEARRLFDEVTCIPLDQVARDRIFLHNMADLAEAATRLDTVDVSARCYEAMRPYAGTTCVAPAMVCFSGAVDHHLGLLAVHLGRVDEAVRHLEIAIRIHQRLGARLWEQASRDLLVQANAAAQSVAPQQGLLARDAKVWRVVWNGAEAHVPDAKGVHDLAVLLERSGEEVHAAELYAARSAGALPVSAAVDRGDAVVDDTARAAYRTRLAALDRELDAAEDDHDLVRVERVRVERDALIDELRRNFDLKGRSRRLGDMSERARKAVTARLRDAIAVIEHSHPSLGAHLRSAVRTGTFCSYQPAEPTAWEVRQI